MMDNPGLTLPSVEKTEQSMISGRNCVSQDNKRRKKKTNEESCDGSDDQLRDSHCEPRSLAKNDRGWRRIIRNLSPSWFSVTMGTGVCANILIVIPWRFNWLYYLGIVFFVLNICLFGVAFVASALRYVIWPEIWIVMVQDPVNSLFLGTVPMGFATIIEMWIAVCVPAWGTWAAYVGLGFWILDACVAVGVTLSLGVLLMSSSHQRSLDTITAVQLLPIAASIVAAGAGSRVAEVLPDPQHAMVTVIVCYVLWGMSMPMAFSVLVIYFHRLALHKMPSREVIVSAFLPLGPMGFGGFGILNLGRVAMDVFPKTQTIDPLAGRFAYIAGFFIALLLWGWGLVWFAFALASIYKSRPVPFNMGWWGFTFPLGVYSVSTICIGMELPSLCFRVLGTIFGAAVIVLWILIATKTAQGAWTGKLFNAPCLARLAEVRVEERDIDYS